MATTPTSAAKFMLATFFKAGRKYPTPTTYRSFFWLASTVPPWSAHAMAETGWDRKIVKEKLLTLWNSGSREKKASSDLSISDQAPPTSSILSCRTQDWMNPLMNIVLPRSNTFPNVPHLSTLSLQGKILDLNHKANLIFAVLQRVIINEMYISIRTY